VESDVNLLLKSYKGKQKKASVHGFGQIDSVGLASCSYLRVDR